MFIFVEQTLCYIHRTGWKFFDKTKVRKWQFGECDAFYENLFSRKALTLIQYGFWSEEERGCYPGLWETEGAGMGCARLAEQGLDHGESCLFGSVTFQ